jgi:dTDP-4-dehydrorhamnose reductase
MKILIIGYNNDLSKIIYEKLVAKGNEVYKSTRNPRGSELYFEIDENSSWKKYNNIEVIIYAAWKMSPRNLSVATKNILAAKTILSLNSDKKLIFISTMSANSFSISKYGKSKYNVEKEFLKLNKHVVKPGILYNKYKNNILGSVGKLVRLLDHLFFLPLINPDFKIFISNVEEVAQRVCNIIDDIDDKGSIVKSISFNSFIKKFFKPKKLQIAFPIGCINNLMNKLPSRYTPIGNIKDSWDSLVKDSSKTFLDNDDSN